MYPKKYVKSAIRTDVPDYMVVLSRLSLVKTLRILHAAMGICTESGELMDEVKKHILYGKDIDDTNLMEETGDLFWYAALLADAVGFTFEQSFEKNIEKLKARYPNRFNEKDAMVRNLSNERAILEK
jgi:NTP pyrophosphatase (non-canonical NTP hydrolase)